MSTPVSTTAAATTRHKSVGTYRQFFATQEDSEILPNEVAGRLAELLGASHYDVHLLLLRMNPRLGACGENLTLSLADLTIICLRDDMAVLVSQPPVGSAG